jgi:UDP-glucose 4-epimerase
MDSRSNIKTVLVTGGCGFIGTNLVKHLSDAGYKIIIIDNLSTGNKETLVSAVRHLHAKDIVIGDIRDRSLLEKVIVNVDAVVHLAAHTSVIESLDKPEICWDINVTGTLTLLEVCRLYKVKKFIFASSNAVLGEQPPPANETKVPSPISPYGASKLAGEALCSTYFHSFNLNTTCLRFANCYGPYSAGKSSVIPKFIRRLEAGEPVIIYGDGNQTRDFVHVDDICQAIKLCITDTTSAAGEIFQIASGIETSVNQLVSILQDITGGTLKTIYEPQRKGEIIRNYSDISKARRMLNYSPVVSLKEGLRRMVQ